MPDEQESKRGGGWEGRDWLTRLGPIGLIGLVILAVVEVLTFGTHQDWLVIVFATLSTIALIAGVALAWRETQAKAAALGRQTRKRKTRTSRFVVSVFSVAAIGMISSIVLNPRLIPLRPGWVKVRVLSKTMNGRLIISRADVTFFEAESRGKQIGHGARTEDDGLAYPFLDIHDVPDWRKHIDKTDIRAEIFKAGYARIVVKVLVQPNTIQDFYIQEERVRPFQIIPPSPK